MPPSLSASVQLPSENGQCPLGPCNMASHERRPQFKETQAWQPIQRRRRRQGRRADDRARRSKVIFASSLGTVFEWYDFYLYGSLAAIIGAQFFAGLDAGHARSSSRCWPSPPASSVRPFGALVFGRLGDLVGRKYTFLVTILIMGLSTFLVGLLPTYATHRRRRAGHPDRAAPAAGPGARRRVRRRRHLRGRARAAGQARRLHLAGSRPRRRWACSCRCW